MKLIKSRKEYTCDLCKKQINKGELYGKKSKSLGSPHKPDVAVRTESGGIAYEMQGVRWTVPICEACA
jgi:hypothetical protein